MAWRVWRGDSPGIARGVGRLGRRRVRSRRRLDAKVGPAIIHVKHERSLGGGFILDVEKGIVATSYRAIEGAKKVTIFFPADKDRKKKEYPADGYFAILPGKDLALIHVNLGGRKAAALKLAEKTPDEGAMVFTFAMPPRTYSASAGVLTNVWTGQKASDLMDTVQQRHVHESPGIRPGRPVALSLVELYSSVSAANRCLTPTARSSG